MTRDVTRRAGNGVSNGTHSIPFHSTPRKALWSPIHVHVAFRNARNLRHVDVDGSLR